MEELGSDEDALVGQFRLPVDGEELTCGCWLSGAVQATSRFLIA
jgi:hypothetical protein